MLCFLKWASFCIFSSFLQTVNGKYVQLPMTGFEFRTCKCAVNCATTTAKTILLFQTVANKYIWFIIYNFHCHHFVQFL